VVVTAFLSVISKASILFVLIPVLYAVFKPLAVNWYRILFLLAILTMIIGNLFALRQENLKRLLAFSSISQIGFMLIGISGSSKEGSASVIYFVLIYLFSNLAAFGVISIVSIFSGKENLENFKGLYKTNPFLSWTLTIAVFSLAGIPPTAGFFGKFFLLMAGAGKGNFILVGIAAANMVLSLYYYLRIVKALFMEESSDPVGRLRVPWSPKIALCICTAAILIIGLTGEVYNYIFSLSRPF
jgi:NADH-quinone oxidoreductase subunit N